MFLSGIFIKRKIEAGKKKRGREKEDRRERERDRLES